MCKHYLSSGTCPNGISCSFAHGAGDLRQPGAGPAHGWPGPGSSGHGGGGRHHQEQLKTVMCKNWTETGNCNYGDKCSFAHSEEEIKQSKEQRIISQNPLFKTTLCKQFTEGEYCELGDNCHFAHGEDELRTAKPLSDPSSDPLFKTVICKNWEEAQANSSAPDCEYGDTCRFAHGKL